MDLTAAIQQWRALLGDANVLQGDAVQTYQHDTGAARRDIPAALRILDASILPEVMRITTRHQVCVQPISTGRNWGYGSALPARDGSVLLDLSPLQRILDFDAELGVVTLEPGVTQQMLDDYLQAGDHPFMVPVTGAGPGCSVLANALERGYGITPHADHFGAVTDLHAVLSDGSNYRSAMYEAGGAELARVFKWGIGPYSTGLFTQSGFGIVTRISIVLARRPACTKACLFALADDALLEPAVLALRELLGRLPGSVGARLQRMTRTLASALELVAGHPNETALALAYWRNAAAAPQHGKDPARDGCGLLWYAPLVVMRPPRVRAYVDMVHRVTERFGLEPLITLTSLNDRLFDSTVPLLFDRQQPAAVAAAQSCQQALLDEGHAQGYFPYRVSVDNMPWLAALQTDAHAFHTRLQRSLDSHGVLSPGRYS